MDANNYCVAEIQHNPLVTGRSEHVDAKHFIQHQSLRTLRQSLETAVSRFEAKDLDALKARNAVDRDVYAHARRVWEGQKRRAGRGGSLGAG